MLGHLSNEFENDFVPYEFYLSPNYPNPFKEKTKIKYCVAYTTRVKLTVFDPEGNEIQKLVDEEKDPGTYEVEFSICHSWESRNLLTGRRGQKSQVYFYRLEAGDYRSEKKMILTK